MPGIASAATSVVLSHIAQDKDHKGRRRRHHAAQHAPYVIAEHFGTLARLFPGRIDLGSARRRHRPTQAARLCAAHRAAENFPQDVLEVQAFLASGRSNSALLAATGLLARATSPASCSSKRLMSDYAQQHAKRRKHFNLGEFLPHQRSRTIPFALVED